MPPTRQGRASSRVSGRRLIKLKGVDGRSDYSGPFFIDCVNLEDLTQVPQAGSSGAFEENADASQDEFSVAPTRRRFHNPHRPLCKGVPMRLSRPWVVVALAFVTAACPSAYQQEFKSG